MTVVCIFILDTCNIRVKVIVFQIIKVSGTNKLVSTQDSSPLDRVLGSDARKRQQKKNKEKSM